MSKADNINPEILEWARETSGLSIEDAATKVGLNSTTKLTAAEKLLAMESGKTRPTRKQLLKLADTYKRPLTLFYRNSPPERGDRGEDFRTTTANISREQTGRLNALLRDIKARQGMVRSIVKDDEDTKALPFIGSVSIDQSVAATTLQIRTLLGLDEATPPGVGKSSSDDLFNDLRIRLEAIGVFVLLAGNLGSHHTNISLDVFRGFAIADSFAPFIVINDQDAKAARPFTLMHEFAHLLTGSTGVSGAPSTVSGSTPLAQVEKYCNDVAGEFLLPETSLSTMSKIDTIVEAQDIIINLAQLFKVSQPMAAYRLMRLGHITNDLYSELVAIFYARWSINQQRAREKATSSDGPSYYVVKKHRLGNALINIVGRTLREGELTHTKAAKVLGVKPNSVEPLIQMMPFMNGAV